MQQGRVSELGGALAVRAAALSVEMKLPLADSIILATVGKYSAELWTQDADFEGIEGVRYRPRRA